MVRTDDLFLHEYLGTPENRVNVALFSLMQQSWFRNWFLEKLKLPTNSIVYPPTNRNGRRPDLKVVDTDDKTLAWIEVELSKDTSQIEDYKRTFQQDTIKALWGTTSDNGDLSLEEVAEYLEGQANLHGQIAVNVQQLAQLIRDGLQGHSPSSGKNALSPEMREHPLVGGLAELLGNKILFDLGENEPPPPGHLKVNTTRTPNNRGFSLRVYSPNSSQPDKTLSVMSISAGRPRVYFPSLERLEKSLQRCEKQIEAYQSALCSMNLDIAKFGVRQRPSLPLEVVVENLACVAPCLQGLADCYGCPERRS